MVYGILDLENFDIEYILSGEYFHRVLKFFSNVSHHHSMSLIWFSNTVFQIKFGRLQPKRINENVSDGIGSLAGWGSIEFYK